MTAKKTNKKTNKPSKYQVVTDRILDALEKGTLPWRKEWRTSGGDLARPRNIKSKKFYRGVNVFMLGMQMYDSPWWGTYKQIQELGGQVRKGEKSTPVVFWTFLEKEDAKAKGGKKTIPLLRQYNVFNVEQADMPEDVMDKLHPVIDTPNAFDPIKAAEAVMAAWEDKPSISHGGNKAFYRPTTDAIQLPKPEAFNTSEAYYATLFHESGHATGHESRLGRDLTGNFGDQSYSFEELVAELTAAMVCAVAGVNNDLGNSAAYIAGWSKKLKNEPEWFVQAAGKAQKAADYILGVTWDNEVKEDEEAEVSMAAA